MPFTRFKGLPPSYVTLAGLFFSASITTAWCVPLRVTPIWIHLRTPSLAWVSDQYRPRAGARMAWRPIRSHHCIRCHDQRPRYKRTKSGTV